MQTSDDPCNPEFRTPSLSVVHDHVQRIFDHLHAKFPFIYHFTYAPRVVIYLESDITSPGDFSPELFPVTTPVPPRRSSFQHIA